MSLRAQGQELKASRLGHAFHLSFRPTRLALLVCAVEVCAVEDTHTHTHQQNNEEVGLKPSFPLFPHFLSGRALQEEAKSAHHCQCVLASTVSRLASRCFGSRYDGLHSTQVQTETHRLLIRKQKSGTACKGNNPAIQVSNCLRRFCSLQNQ